MGHTYFYTDFVHYHHFRSLAHFKVGLNFSFCWSKMCELLNYYDFQLIFELLQVLGRQLLVHANSQLYAIR